MQMPPFGPVEAVWAWRCGGAECPKRRKVMNQAAVPQP